MYFNAIEMATVKRFHEVAGKYSAFHDSVMGIETPAREISPF
tara:strand:+ start:5383 stop:5508 length:126 start_codon:yes stop_codon:yes gene_type:complete